MPEKTYNATENKQEKPKDRPFIKWLNEAGQSWKDFWDTPVTMQYAYNPHAVVGNVGAPFSTTQRRGDFASQTAASIAIPATAVGVATVGTVPTLIGMGTGMGVGTAADVGGSKLVELVGGDKNAQEMVGDIAGFTLGALAGGKATKATTKYLNFWNSWFNPKSISTAMAEGMAPIKTSSAGVVTNRVTRAAKMSEAERLGIPKGERNQWLRGNTADASWDTGLGLNNSKYMQQLTDLHFKLAAPKTQTSGVYLNESRYGQNFTIFDRNKIAGPNAEGNIFDPQGRGFVGIYNPPYRGFFFRPLETQTKMMAQGFASMDGTRAYRLNVTNPRVTKSETSRQLYKLWDHRHDQYVPSENNGLIRYTSMYDTPFEVQAMDPTQIKLYQWNTYDDAGNLIPLSQRHDFTNKDIRYKSGGTIRIKKKNEGKFSKVRDYIDYKNSK